LALQKIGQKQASTSPPQVTGNLLVQLPELYPLKRRMLLPSVDLQLTLELTRTLKNSSNLYSALSTASFTGSMQAQAKFGAETTRQQMADLFPY
jgi:hypothetical protein